jgi:hypothetical protein
MKFSTKALATVAIAAATLATAQSAAALTYVYDLGGAAVTNMTSLSYAGTPAGGPSLQIGGVTFGFNPNGINGDGNNITDYTAANIFRDATGVGVCNSGETASSTAPCSTVDTQNPNGRNSDENEGLTLSFGSAVTLSSVTISQFVPDSTIALWQIDSGGNLNQVFDLTPIGTQTSPYTIDLSAFNFTQSFWTLTNSGNGNNPGYHINQIVVSVADPTAPAPEPATWAMMITGFGGVGALIRRRRSTLAMVPVKA